jgi:hypothetical protein
VTELFTGIAEETRGQRLGLGARRAVLTAFAAISLLAVAGVFGQVATSSTTTGAAATLRLRAPDTVRGGLFFEARLDIRAARAIQHPRLVLDDGWLEGLQVNSIEPAPVSEASRDGRVVLTYGGLAAGDRLVVWLQFEVDPTSVGRRSFGVELDEAETRLARIDRHLTMLP